MKTGHAKVSSEVDMRINEAEVCYSMGLYDESLGIYEQLLASLPNTDVDKLDSIKARIDEIRQEISDRDLSDTKKVSAKDISMVKKTLSNRDAGNDVLSGQTVLDSAASFKELGLFNEAVSEYEKLIAQDYPPEKIAGDFADCLLKINSPDKLFEYVLQLVGDPQLPKETRATIQYLFGQEMEKRDHKDPALDFYKAALKANPTDTEIRKRLDGLTASLSSKSKYDYLMRQNMVDTDQLQKAFVLSKKMNKSVEFVLTGQYGIRKSDIGKSFSAYYGCPFREYDPNLTVPHELLNNLKETFLLNEGWVPLNWDKDFVEVLVDDPRNLNKTDNIKTLLNTPKINFSVAIKEDIEEFIKRFFDKDNSLDDDHGDDNLDNFDIIPDVSFEEEEDDEIIDETDESSSKVVKLVDQFIIAAYRKNASDIHIEPSPTSKATTIRFRMDGVCQEYLKVPNSMARGILSRIKIMSQLDIAERRLPQDGKIKFKRKGIPAFELRVATLPTTGGFEDAVLRILAKAGAMKLEDMGLTERNYTVLESVIKKPYGLVLCVGPTGSGKTTTLHAALGNINEPGIKIWTAEDPVEITQAGLRQVEAKPRIGLNFARIMRAFLRSDPDVIMIGEMRDEETASIGVEASLTGHLVFSTLHTNSAPETITRLLDMGLNPLNFSDAFLAVLAQRLVRRLCPNCAKEYNPPREEFEEITSDYGKKAFDRSGIHYDSDLILKSPGSCEMCSGTGYRGRLGIHELMEGTPTVKRMIKKQASTEELFEQAALEGMTTLKQDGLLKVFKGVTDIREVRRVCIN
jgi:type II secretory ATPase GspE/PulE/Tfp pilus assembly ATPase PilB-like protein/tetratricopeptide (TPR) repeat protein